MIKFGEFTPDVPSVDNTGLVKAENILPGSASYLPFPKATPDDSGVLDARPQGNFTAKDPTTFGTSYLYVGTKEDLFVRATDGTFTDVSRTVSSTYATADAGTWEFCLFGTTAIATNFNDEIQAITLGASNFANLAGSPPKARHIDVVDNFVVVGNTDNSPMEVRWSAIGDETSWAASATTQASSFILRNNAGWIQKIVGGDYGLIFQERAISKMTYVGSPLIFQIDELERERGAIASGSVIKIGKNVAYLSADGFYVFDGYSSIPIGNKKIDKTFFNDPNGLLTYDPRFAHRMSSANYPKEQIIVWSYTSINSDDLNSGTPDTLLFYNYAPKAETRWSYALVQNHELVETVTLGYTLESLDNYLVDGVGATLETLPYSLDSPFWVGGQDILGCIGTDLELNIFNGSAMTATLQTGETQLNPPKRTKVNRVRPFIDGRGNITVAIGTRNLQSEDIDFGPNLTLNNAGFANTRANGRFHTASVTISPETTFTGSVTSTLSFTSAEGIDLIQATPVGLR